MVCIVIVQHIMELENIMHHHWRKAFNIVSKRAAIVMHQTQGFSCVVMRHEEHFNLHLDDNCGRICCYCYS